MYPSLNAFAVAKEVREEFLRSDLEVVVDSVELGLYLAIIYQNKRKDLDVLGLDDKIPKRRSRGKDIKITTDEVTSARRRGERPPGSDKSLFRERESEPRSDETRLMFALVLEEGIKIVMNHHTHTFQGD